jgi:hypothetical protein
MGGTGYCFIAESIWKISQQRPFLSVNQLCLSQALGPKRMMVGKRKQACP